MGDRAVVVLVSLLGACGEKPEEPEEPEQTEGGEETGETGEDTAEPPIDADGDGYASEADCDDGDEAVHPGAAEVCDGIDNNCDAQTDEDSAIDAAAWHLDADGDGYGDADGAPLVTCDPPAGEGPEWVADGSDCDDANASIYPGAPEICGDGAANDCDAAPGDSDAACPLSGELGPSDAYATFFGARPDEHAGYFLAGAGDVDGDGLDDALVGAPTNDAAGSSAGAVFLVRGGASGDLNLAGAHAKLTGENPLDFAGAGLAGAGDVDGDGLADLLVGAYGVDEGDDYAGAAYLVYGPVSGTFSLSAADARLIGEGVEAGAGVSVAGPGDVSGDGVPDLLVGADGADGDAEDEGAAYLVLGGVSGDLALSAGHATLRGGSAYQYAGFAVAGAGDADGDGLADLLVGAFGQSAAAAFAGAAYLVRGPISSGEADLPDVAHATLQGGFAYQYAGFAVAGVGDTDGDGRDDLLIGASGTALNGGSSGAAYLVLGGVSGTLDLSAAHAVLIGEHAEDYAGRSVARAGDVDGDGLMDLLISAEENDLTADSAGAAYLVLGGVSGALELSAADARFRGGNSGDDAGADVAGAGDADGDGLGDILIGAGREDSAGEDAGAVYLLGPRL